MLSTGENMVSKSLGKRVKEYRLANLKTQRQMAAILDISLATLCRIEQGSTSIADLTRAKIEKFLNSQAVAA